MQGRQLWQPPQRTSGKQAHTPFTPFLSPDKNGVFFAAFYPQPVDNFCGLCVIFYRIYAYFTLFFLSVYFVSKIGHFVCPTAQQAAKLL